MTTGETTFHSLYDAHAADVFRFARYLTGSDDAAADVTSETFLRAWAGRDAIRAGTAKAYLLTIARNLVRDGWQRVSAYRRTHGGQFPATLAELGPQLEAQAARSDYRVGYFRREAGKMCFTAR